MTLEQVLGSLGNLPISSTPQYLQMLAFINGSLTRAGMEKVEPTMPSDQVLARIYSVGDNSLQSLILNKDYAGSSSRDSYKTVIIACTTIIVAIVIAILIGVVKSGAPMDENTTGLLKTVITGAFDLIKMLISNNSPASP